MICATQREPFVDHDCCLAAQTLMLSALERGLSTCWIGFAEAWLNTPRARQELGIAKDHIPIAPVIIGYPQTIPPPTARQHPEIAGWASPKPELPRPRYRADIAVRMWHRAGIIPAYPFMQTSGRRLATLRASPAFSVAITTAATSL